MCPLGNPPEYLTSVLFHVVTINRNYGFSLNKYVGPTYCRVEMYAGRVACCPLVSTTTDGQTDRRQTVALRFRYGCGLRNNASKAFGGRARTIAFPVNCPRWSVAHLGQLARNAPMLLTG